MRANYSYRSKTPLKKQINTVGSESNTANYNTNMAKINVSINWLTIFSLPPK